MIKQGLFDNEWGKCGICKQEEGGKRTEGREEDGKDPEIKIYLCYFNIRKVFRTCFEFAPTLDLKITERLGLSL